MPNTEQAVRDAASKLSATIKAAQEEGYWITWPSTIEGIDAIEISETAKVAVKVTTTVQEGLDPDIPAKASAAAQKAADKVVSKA